MFSTQFELFILSASRQNTLQLVAQARVQNVQNLLHYLSKIMSSSANKSKSATATSLIKQSKGEIIT